jgi:transposase InsO family protein
VQLYWLWVDTQPPCRLQSDNGMEFCAAIVAMLCKAFGVHQVHGAIGRPQSQGAVERCNRSIKDKIRGLLMAAPTHRCCLTGCRHPNVYCPAD